jgi:pimeloyl-ACP methyl ester carboxylesterase
MVVTVGFKRFVRRTRGAGVPSLVVRLPDGRSIAVEEYGDPTGPVVLYFHGWPASRLEAGLIPDLPVRLLALDRPGYGRSSAQPGRTLLDWPKDVADVADRLGLDQFYLVGLSGGAPYAVACAYALPDRVLGAALVCPVPPMHGIHPRAPGVGHLFRLGRHPVLAHRLFSVVRPLLRRRIITPRMLVGRSLPAADRECLDAKTLAGLARIWREGIGCDVQGALSDAQIYARDWDVPISEISVPMDVWYGEQDSLIPPHFLAPFEAIPGMVLHRVPNEGHYSLALRHAATILRHLTNPQTSEKLRA